MNRRWRVDRAEGTAGELHARSAALVEPERGRRPARRVQLLDPSERAVSLGSAQPRSHVDAARAAMHRVAVARRRSGGGAVLVGPGLTVWIDLVIPAGDPLWEDDVARAFWWLGSAWAGALADAGVPGGEVWRKEPLRSAWSDRVCFAGVGAGEVTVGTAKAVGISQRRTRIGALFQCAVPVVWAPTMLLDVLVLDDAQRAAGAIDLAGSALGVGPAVAGRLAAALIDRLP